MGKSARTIRIVAIVFLNIALAYFVFGTIVMFCDTGAVYHKGYNEESYSQYYPYNKQTTWVEGYWDYYPNPVAGVMPLFGTFLVIGALIMLICGAKKPKLNIGTICSIAAADILFGLSILIPMGMTGTGGYFINMIGLCFAFFAWVLAIVTLVLGLSARKKEEQSILLEKAAIATTEEVPVSESNTERRYKELRMLKELFDQGVLTEPEYLLEKEKIIRKIR